MTDQKYSNEIFSFINTMTYCMALEPNEKSRKELQNLLMDSLLSIKFSLDHESYRQQQRQKERASEKTA